MITVRDLKNILDTKEQHFILIDVRTKEEFNEGHVPGAKNIPLDEIASKIEELTSYDMVYVICQSGGRSAMAAQVISTAGICNVQNVMGGTRGWIDAGFNIE